MISSIKFAFLMGVFHVCKGFCNAATTVGSVALSHATPIVATMDPQTRDRIESAYLNKNQEWN